MENYLRPVLTEEKVKAISSLGLAHVGDGVFELLCRSYLCVQGKTTVKNLHKCTVGFVNAPAQAKFADVILPHLTETEQDYYRRGKNAHTHAAPGAATRQEYAKATGLEALFGALYLLGETERVNELFNLGMEALYGL